MWHSVCELSHVIGYWTRNWKRKLLWGIDYLLQPAENSGSVRLPDVHVISFSASFCSQWVLWRVSFLRPTFSNKQHSKLTLNSAGSLISRYLWPKLVLRYSSVCFSAVFTLLAHSLLLEVSGLSLFVKVHLQHLNQDWVRILVCPVSLRHCMSA